MMQHDAAPSYPGDPKKTTTTALHTAASSRLWEQLWLGTPAPWEPTRRIPKNAIDPNKKTPENHNQHPKFQTQNDTKCIENQPSENLKVLNNFCPEHLRHHPTRSAWCRMAVISMTTTWLGAACCESLSADQPPQLSLQGLHFAASRTTMADPPPL